MPDSYRWFVLIDSRKARLLRASHTGKGSLHLDEVASLATTFVAGEHHRPDRLGAPGRSAGTGHEHAEKLAHFARELAPWLQKQLVAQAVTHCDLFSPAHMLGELRKSLGKALTTKLVEHDVELTGLPIAQLAVHPRIQALWAS
ncbi:MAG: host attachment protein [Planctomycetota bacterium]